MTLRYITEIVQFVTMWENMYQQRLSWDDAAKGRINRDRAELRSEAQLQRVLQTPSSQLGTAKLNDEDALDQSGLL